ncbi:josephin-2 isoform X2 [Hydra vulgaris]|uniref:josephin-2 isoform X2 n=2 Tax=Hydra vulgaris TaxID=6087 RepID=UPI001F5F8661|nr:josephin-2-like isoform X2 [Hydra vulgaris]
MTAKDNMSSIYHEKQRSQLCAVHAINNLFQDGLLCSKNKLDKLCLQLDPSVLMNQHRSMFGTGNYDINVIMVFLNDQGYDVIWFDKRKTLNEINIDEIVGFLVNTLSSYKVFGRSINLFLFKHWYAIRSLNGIYFNLDSKLQSPMKIGDRDSVLKYLNEIINEGHNELLIVVKKGSVA